MSPPRGKLSAHAPSILPLGAAGEVTGSCYLIDTGQARILLECGLFQGGRNADARNRARWRFRIDGIDAVVLSHAHLDHSGLVPRLVREGYGGPVYASAATCELLAIMWQDAAHLNERDVFVRSHGCGWCTARIRRVRRSRSTCIAARACRQSRRWRASRSCCEAASDRVCRDASLHPALRAHFVRPNPLPANWFGAAR